MIYLISWVGHSFIDTAGHVICYMELKNKHDIFSLISQLRQSGMQCRWLGGNFSFLTLFPLLRKIKVFCLYFVLCFLKEYSQAF